MCSSADRRGNSESKALELGSDLLLFVLLLICVGLDSGGMNRSLTTKYLVIFTFLLLITGYMFFKQRCYIE